MSKHFAITLTLIAALSLAFTAWARTMAAPPPSDAYLEVAAQPLVVPANARVAVFAGGCFWGTEETFRALPGVIATQTGYAGGTAPHPTYHSIHSKEGTGYVESVKIVYDPSKVAYRDLLLKFFATHDPTLPHPGLKKQIGSAYRSFVFCADSEQTKATQAVIRELNQSGRFAFPIATQVRPATAFHPAEEKHQSYYAKRDRIIQCQP